MLKPRNRWINARSDSAYVCVRCRVKAQQPDIRQLNRHPTKRWPDSRENITSRRAVNSCEQGTYFPSSRSLRTSSSRFCEGWTDRVARDKTSVCSKSHARAYHASSRSYLPASVVAEEISNQTSFQPFPESYSLRADKSIENPNGIRAQLRAWHDLHGHEAPGLDPSFPDDVVSGDQMSNNLSRIPDERNLSWQARADDDLNAHSRYADTSKEGFDGSEASSIFLRMGDLVEIPYLKSDRESELAVFVRRISGCAQCYTINGRWTHTLETIIPYSIPGWISPKLIEPMLQHLPDAKDLEDREALWIQRAMEDLSVPRDVASPIVSRLVAFQNESQAIYRKHAGALDAVHSILAHPTDLRYGSLISAATTLLKMSSDQLPPAALYTVRKAIADADFGFSIEASSHRQTGYMQILSKDHVRLIEKVRDWLRQWQDDAAAAKSMSAKQRARHVPSSGAQIVYQYIEKAKTIILENRRNRAPTIHGCVGPSNVRFPITPQSDSVRVKVQTHFSQEEQEITRFIEAWCTTLLFHRLPRLQAMPPLILQATGLYPDMKLEMATAHIFLQELGVIMPYDHRKHFDPDLLLPTSQHSRPLQVLDSKLRTMRGEDEFADSMADLRHDWGELPVYCIDGADAQEIDDGLSIESAGIGSDGRQQFWVHVHIANPTAFFSRDHPMAKMARHMGETVYMPEHTFPMLPHWASRNWFSLGKDRPCLTVSAKMDEDGETLEHRITNGIIHNTISLTPDEVNGVLGAPTSHDIPTLVLRVGGEPPPSRGRRSAVNSLSESQIAELRTLQRLSNKRFDMRKAGGGIFFDIPRPEVRVWQGWTSPGLAWHHPYRHGSRTVEGDPVIEYRTQEYRNWFKPRLGTSDTLVREMMLLACETSAKWCAERNIPIIYRGTTDNPDGLTPAEFRRQVILPEVGEDTELPMHLGLKYMKTLGPSVLSSTPVKHEIMGMAHYSKVTSPLRRYGDMILHWQIEAVLRHEASTGQSLVGQAAGDQSFLPFSAPVLDIIVRGLRPRERTVMLAKRHSERFWFLMLLMRRHFFGEDGGFPYATFRVMVTSDPSQTVGRNDAVGFSMEMNCSVQMNDPDALGLGKAKEGDIWECQISEANVYMHTFYVTPVRLIERPN